MEIDRLYEELNECQPDQQREFIAKNYKQIKFAASDHDPTLQKFLKNKSKFMTCENLLKSISADIAELEYARLKTKALEDDYSDASEDSDEEYSPAEQADIKAEDEISEMLDNLNSASYERDYKDAMQYYELLVEMLKSEKYAALLKKPGIKKSVHQCYSTLSELLLNDYENENPAFNQQELIGFLFKINQSSTLITKFLEIKQRKLYDSFSKYFNSSVGLDIDHFEKVIHLFLQGLLDVCEDFESQFKNVLAEANFIFCRVSNWVQDQCFRFYGDISPALFQSYDLEEILKLLKDLFNNVSDFEKSGLSLSVPLQKYIIPDLDMKLDELFEFFEQNIQRLQNSDTDKLYPIFILKDIIYSDDELTEPQTQPINQDGIITTLLFPQDIKIRSTVTIKQIFTESKQPCGIIPIYFWNVVFRLTDKVLEYMQHSDTPLLNASLGLNFQTKLRAFIANYLKIFKSRYIQMLQPSRQTLLIQIANSFSNFTFCNLISQFYNQTGRKPKSVSSQSKEWGQTIQMWFQESQDLIQALFNGRILELMPFLFANSGRVYCQQLTSQNQDVVKPSLLFLQLTYLINDTKQDLIGILQKQPLNFYLNSLHDQIKYMIEYIIYWYYHNLGKTNEVFFMERKDRDKLGLNTTQINLFLQQNALKLSYFTQIGVQQFVFDLVFLATFYSKYLIPSVQQNNDSFIKKTVALYNKEKGLTIDYKALIEKYSPSMEKYVMQSLDQEFVQMAALMKKLELTQPNNYVFKQSIYDVS